MENCDQNVLCEKNVSQLINYIYIWAVFRKEIRKSFRNPERSLKGPGNTERKRWATKEGSQIAQAIRAVSWWRVKETEAISKV